MLTVKFSLVTLWALSISVKTEPHGTVPDSKPYITLARKLQQLQHQWQEDREQRLREKQHYLDEIAELKDRCRSNDDAEGGSTYERAFSRLPHPRAVDTSDLQAVVSQMEERLYDMEAEVEALKNSNSQQDSAIQEAGTSTFIHWGSSSCPGSTELVYSGVVGGGGHSHHSGNPTSTHCLPLNPVLENTTIPRHSADLHGGEYQTYDDDHYNNDPLCAVCLTPRPTNIMVPATNRCQDGWTLEYSGYFMGSSTQYTNAHDSVCMDSKLEERPDSENSTAALLFYYTFTVCGSLPCPPYEDRQLVLCAVCSK